MIDFFIDFCLGMIGIYGLKLREKSHFNNPSKTSLISLSLGLGASSSIILPFLSG
jgi:xanthine/uracil permease